MQVWTVVSDDGNLACSSAVCGVVNRLFDTLVFFVVFAKRD